MRVAGLLALSMSMSLSCAHPLGTFTQRASRGAVEIATEPGVERDVELTARAAERALPHLARWGPFEKRPTIYLLPTHDQLESLVRKPGYRWLRAWAQYDTIYLQTPAAWAPPAPTEDELAELLTHELTHCLLFQRAGTADDWASKDIPLWFREGMAIATANQGWRYGSLEDLTQWSLRTGHQDLLEFDDATLRDDERTVYGAALHAFRFLVGRHGDVRVKKLLQRMRAGARFPIAFRIAMGESPDAFGEAFRVWLIDRNFVKPLPPPRVPR